MLPAVRRCGPPAAAAAAAPLLGISLTVSSLAPPSSMQESDRIILASWPSGGQLLLRERTAHTCNGTASMHGFRGGVAFCCSCCLSENNRQRGKVPASTQYPGGSLMKRAGGAGCHVLNWRNCSNCDKIQTDTRCSEIRGVPKLEKILGGVCNSRCFFLGPT